MNVYTEQQYVIYESQNKSVTTPQSPASNQDKLQNNQNTYYNIYNYQYWIYLVNNAFTTCFNNLLTAAGTLPTSNPPVMTFDTTNGIAILNVDYAGYNNQASDYIRVYFNQPMYELFNSFPVVIQSLGGKVLIENSSNNLYTNLITDFVDDGNYKPQIIYEPTAEYRFFSLAGNTEIRTIQLSVYYRNKVGILQEVYLSNGNSFTCKVLFKKKKKLLLQT
jgi:hypothetical protein